ncbi:MAG: type I methionyl aminopeptidase [Candidatus Paceibacterota bacterium]|jgi:methionyl aminopeptidase
MTFLKKENEIEVLKEGGAVLFYILKTLSKKAGIGVNLLDLEKMSINLFKEQGMTPAFLGYQPEGAQHPYPASMCLSVNEVVVHGIPKKYILKNGDVLKIDMGVIHKGLYTDSALTLGIGKISNQAQKLILSTKIALNKAIEIAKPGKTLGDIGWTIENEAKKGGFKVIKGLTGHGVGYELHEDPIILNYGKKKEGGKLVPGMVLAIEPMFSLSSENIIQNDDESYSSSDGSLTAHFEHTIAITQKGNIVLTL